MTVRTNGLLADAPAGKDVDPAGQLPHWMFAMHDTLAANAFRANESDVESILSAAEDSLRELKKPN